MKRLSRKAKILMSSVVVTAFAASTCFMPLSCAAVTGTPIIQFISEVQNMTLEERQWIKDEILKDLSKQTTNTEIQAKRGMFKAHFPSIQITNTDLDAALNAFADIANDIKVKAEKHLVSEKQNIPYTAGSFDAIKAKIQNNVGSLDNFIAFCNLLQDVTGWKSLFTDVDAIQGTIKPSSTITANDVGGQESLDQLNDIVASIAGLPGLDFLNVNTVLVVYTDILNNTGTLQERISFEKFLYNYGSQNGKHLYDGANSPKSNGGSDSGNIDSVDTTKKPAAQESTPTVQISEEGQSTVIELTSTVTAGENGVASFSQTQVQTILEKIAEVSKNKETAEEKKEDKVEAKIVIAVEADEQTLKSSVNIPANIVEAAKTNKIDIIEVSTPVATIMVPPSVISSTKFDTINIETKIINNDKELTAQQKATVGDSLVYDFNITSISNNISTKISNFTSDVQIAIPYTLKEDDNADKITVYFINDEGQLENMQGVYDPDTKTVRFSTRHFSKYLIKFNNVTFNDISKYAWAKNQIEYMAAKGVITGKADGVFEPGANITRAEFSALLVRMFKLPESNQCITCKFSDTSANAWYASPVMSAVEAGLVTGYENGTFRPNDKISRQDMAVMISRALEKYKGLEVVQDLDQNLDFSDNNIMANYSKPSIATIVKYGIVKGNPDKTFKPASNLTRAEAAIVINNVFKLK